MNDVTPPIPVCVIGVGRMGQHHARIYSQLPGAKLVAVCDQSPEHAKKIADLYGCQTFFTVPELLAAKLPIRAASVAVPTIYHRQVAESLLPAGIDCLIEKPLAQLPPDAAAIVDLAKRHNRILQVGHTERFNPVVRALAQYNLKPKFLEIDRISPMTFRSIDVSVVLDMMIHDLDLVNYLVRSPVTHISAVGVPVISPHEDIANVRLTFANNAVANITASRLAFKTDRKMRIFTPDTYVSVDYQKKSGIVIHKAANEAQFATFRAMMAAGQFADLTKLNYAELVKVEELQIVDQEPLKAELESFLHCVATRTKPEVPGEDGLAAVELAARIAQCIAAHTWDGGEGGK